MFASLVAAAAVVGFFAGIILAHSANQSNLAKLLFSNSVILAAAVFLVVTSTLGRWTGVYGHGFSDFAYLVSVVIVGINVANHAVIIYRGARKRNHLKVDSLK